MGRAPERAEGTMRGSKGRVRRPGRGRAGFTLIGFTLIETVMGLAVVVIALLATIGTIGTSMTSTRTLNERELAMRAALAKAAELDAADFTKLFVLYDEDDTNDPPGALGPYFDVAGLTPSAVAPGGRVGQVVFPVSGKKLREDVVLPALGMPRDLNADALVDNANHDADYRILPALIRLDWQGVNGRQRLELATVISARD